MQRSRKQRPIVSKPAIDFIKSKRYRCHWLKASGINRFRAFSARNITSFFIDANSCLGVVSGKRTPCFQTLVGKIPVAPYLKAQFKKGAAQRRKQLEHIRRQKNILSAMNCVYGTWKPARLYVLQATVIRQVVCTEDFLLCHSSDMPPRSHRTGRS